MSLTGARPASGGGAAQPGGEQWARAPFGRRAAPVVEHRRVGAYHVLTVADPAEPPVRPRAGQFYMLAAEHDWGGRDDERPFLARAFSVLRAREGRGEPVLLDFLLETVGPGTARLCEAGTDEALWIMGPLGVGFTAPAAGRRPVLVGGGVGIAPLAIWQDELAAAEAGETVLLGFRDGEHAAGAALLSGAAVVTDDGSVGDGGLVTELLAAELDRGAEVTIYACGPPPMLEAVRALCADRGVPAQLALESGMACGFGGCFGCVVPTRGGDYLRVCVEGPVVDAARLDSALAPAHTEP